MVFPFSRAHMAKKHGYQEMSHKNLGNAQI